MIDKATHRAYRFFREQGNGAGYALQLAKAEAWAQENNVEMSWKWDDDADLTWCDECDHLRQCKAGDRNGRIRPENRGCHDCTNRAHYNPHEHEVMGCVAKGPDNLNVSLWGITDPNQEYRRVVEAEMALELRDTVEGTADMYARHFAE